MSLCLSLVLEHVCHVITVNVTDSTEVAPIVLRVDVV